MIAINNPGNIRYNPDFKGCTGQTKGFCNFSSMGFGYRAILTLLTTYYDKYQLKTIRGILTRYAPPSENQTENYIAFLSRNSGFDPGQVLTKADLMKLIPGIVKMENGINITAGEVQTLIAQANSSGTIALSALAVILALYFGYTFLK
jgi:hypothetical protein